MSELITTQRQLETPKTQHQEQTKILAATKEEL